TCSPRGRCTGRSCSVRCSFSSCSTRGAGSGACCRRHGVPTAEPLLAVRGLIKRFGGLVATDGIDLDVAEGETLAVIGPNGAGKTTLIGQLSGDLPPDAGSIRFAGVDVTALPAPARSQRGLRGRHTIVLVEHDMDVVWALADRIAVMVYGRVIACGTPEAIRANAEVRRAYLGEEVPA